MICLTAWKSHPVPARRERVLVFVVLGIGGITPAMKLKLAA